MQGRRLKELVEKKGFNKEAFANAVGIHRIYLHQVFNNKIIPDKLIKKLASKLKMTPDELTKILKKPIRKNVIILFKNQEIKQLKLRLKKALRLTKQLKEKIKRVNGRQY